MYIIHLNVFFPFVSLSSCHDAQLSKYLIDGLIMNLNSNGKAIGLKIVIKSQCILFSHLKTISPKVVEYIRQENLIQKFHQSILYSSRVKHIYPYFTLMIYYAPRGLQWHFKCLVPCNVAMESLLNCYDTLQGYVVISIRGKNFDLL